LGGYESNFLKFQAIAYASRVRFAHNDYLQALAELGLVGFAILLAGIYGVSAQIFKGIARLVEPDRRLLVIACGASVVAILLHSLVDFNLHIPANAMTLAWIAGVGSINGLD
jgi:O-antigen ligase